MMSESHALVSCPLLYSIACQEEQGVEENIWIKEEWSDVRVEKAA
jgi:hypothetical protein